MVQPFHWPPATEQKFAQIADGQEVAFIGHTDGHIEFRVQGPQGDFSAHSAPLVFNGPIPYLQLFGIWNQGKATIYVPSSDPNSNTPFRRYTSPRETSRQKALIFNLAEIRSVSFDDPNVTSACRGWIKNRKSKFATNPALRHPDRRYKTIQEECFDLKVAINNLIYIRAGLEQGQTYLLGHMAAELRALLFWKSDADQDLTYSPLLFRLASKLDLALPVYSAKVLRPVYYGIPTPTIQVCVTPPEIVRTMPNFRVMDLQAWLNMVAMMDHRISMNGIPRQLKIREIISETANSLGAAHYTVEISEFLDILIAAQVFSVTTLQSFLISTSRTVEELCKYAHDSIIVNVPGAYRA